jgi:hypothetical protein
MSKIDKVIGTRNPWPISGVPRMNKFSLCKTLTEFLTGVNKG